MAARSCGFTALHSIAPACNAAGAKIDPSELSQPSPWPVSELGLSHPQLTTEVLKLRVALPLHQLPEFRGNALEALRALYTVLSGDLHSCGPAKDVCKGILPCSHASAADHMNRVIQARTQMPHIA